MPAVHEHHLSNGMTLLCFPQEHLHSVHMGLYLKGGTLYENRQNQGVGHLLEHLCFRSLGGLSHDALQQTLSRMGAELDGATYSEAIVFDLTALPRYLEQMTELFLRFFADVPWTQEQIDAEKQVVLRQIEEDDCDFEEQIDRRYRRTAAGAFPRMGTADSVAAMTEATIRRWQRAIFQPQNACLCVAGRVTEAGEQALVKAFSALENRTDNLPFAQAVPKSFCMRDISSDLVMDEPGGHAKVHIAFDLEEDRVYPLVSEVLCAITGGNDDSLLFQTLREQEALVAEIDSSIEEMGLFRRLVIRYDVRQECLTDSLREVFSLLRRLRMYIRPVRLELARLPFTDNNDMLLDSPAGMCELMGWAWLADDLSRADLDAQAAMYDDLTTEDLLDAAQVVYRPENLCVTIQRDPSLTPKSMKPLLTELRAMLA